MRFKKDVLAILFLFVFAMIIRSWPQVKAGMWPIGYDTFNTYAPDLLKFDGHFLRWFFSANLLYFLLWPFYKFLAVNPYFVVKYAGPILYGLFGLSFFIFCRKYFKWSVLISFMAGLLFLVQLPTLRMSWDLFRNMLGLIFLFPALYLLENNGRLRNLILLMILSVLIILSNQLVAGLWFVVVFIWLLKNLIEKKYQNISEILIVVIPSLVIFFLSLRTPAVNDFGGHVIYKDESDIIYGYFEAYRHSLSYRDLASTIFGYFWLNFNFVLPLALYGWWILRKNLILSTLTIWLLIGTFSALIFGGYGLFFWSRWLLMLSLPFTIYTVVALIEIGRRISKLKIFQPKILSSLFKFVSVVVLIAYFGLFICYNFPFISTPSQEAKPPFKSEKYNSLLPPSMINNSVGFESIKEVEDCIAYLNVTPTNSVVLIDNRYRGMVLTNLDYSQRYVYTYPWSPKINQALIDELRTKNIGPIYMIWTSHESIPEFDRAFQSGQNSVYRDKTTYANYQEKIRQNQ